MKPLNIAIIVIVIVIALVGVVVLGGFLDNDDEEEPANLLEKIQQRGKIIVGTQVPYPPFENINATTNELEGIDIEIMLLVADALGVEVEWTQMDFDPLFGAVQTGQIDCAISSITITAEREQTLNFSTPYYVANQAVLVHDDADITEVEDLNGTKVVVQLGTTGSYWADEFLVDAGLVDSGDYSQFTDVPAAVLTVQNKQNDAFIVDTPVANKYAGDNVTYDLKIGFIIQTNENYGIMIPQDEPELKAAINEALEALIEDGTIDEILAKWM